MRTRIFISGLLLAFFCYSRPLQAQSFQKGDNVISAGYGFGSLYQALAYGFASSQIDHLDTLPSRASITGPLYFKYEFGINKWLSLGASYAVFTSTSVFNFQDLGDTIPTIHKATVKYNSFSLLARLNLHLAPRSRYLDPYIGIGFGVRNFNYYLSTDDFRFSPLRGLLYIPGFEATFGLRGYITPNIGVYTEIGAAKSFLQLGVCAKF